MLIEKKGKNFETKLHRHHRWNTSIHQHSTTMVDNGILGRRRNINSFDVSIYLYQVSSSGITVTTFNTWYTWAALAFVIVGGILSIVGSVVAKGKTILLIGAVLTLLSIIIFALGLQMDLSSNLGEAGIGLFSSGSYLGANFSSYLSFGFWIALVAAIIAFVAYTKHPAEVAAPPS